MRVESSINFMFSFDNNGNGNSVRLQTGGPGLASVTGFSKGDSSFNIASGGWTGYYDQSGVYGSVWYDIKIQIDSNGLAKWYLDGLLRTSNFALVTNGTIIGIHGDQSGSGGSVDDICIYRGII